MNNRTDFNLKQLETLVGGRITGVARSGSSDPADEFFGLIVRPSPTTHFVIWFLSDAEGNGPGSFLIETISQEEPKADQPYDWLVRIKQGFASSSAKTPEFKRFAQLFRSTMTKFLRGLGVTDIKFSTGHFYIAGFFDLGGQTWYLNTGDVRWLSGSGMLIRTAKDHQDYLGGRNQYIEYKPGFYVELAATLMLKGA